MQVFYVSFIFSKQLFGQNDISQLVSEKLIIVQNIGTFCPNIIGRRRYMFVGQNKSSIQKKTLKNTYIYQ